MFSEAASNLEESLKFSKYCDKNMQVKFVLVEEGHLNAFHTKI